MTEYELHTQGARHTFEPEYDGNDPSRNRSESAMVLGDEEIMSKVQEFASTWAIAGGRFDDGTAIERAEACKEEIRVLLARYHQPVAPELSLDAPAQVNNIRFGKGCKWSSVVEAAQRHYTYMQDPTREAERIKLAEYGQKHLAKGEMMPSYLKCYEAMMAAQLVEAEARNAQLQLGGADIEHDCSQDVAPQPAQPVGWEDAKRITDLPEVDELLQGFAEDPTGDAGIMIVRAVMQAVGQPAANAEPLVRYCPGCGSIGSVELKYRDCCPDGSEARMIPLKLAEKCRDTFQIAIRILMAEARNAQLQLGGADHVSNL